MRRIVSLLLLAMVVVVGGLVLRVGSAATQSSPAGTGGRPTRVTVDTGDGCSFWVEETLADKGAPGGALLQGGETVPGPNARPGSPSWYWTVYYLGREADGTGHLELVMTPSASNQQQMRTIAFNANDGYSVRLATGAHGHPLVTFRVKEVSDVGISIDSLSVK
jgi:hypothetical protein